MKHPEKLGPFRITRVIGRGGMGAVYQAVHEETQDVVALKVLMAAVDEDAESKNRFEAEIDTLKRLRHPNIVRLYGFGQEEGMLYYAMEFVDGPSLANLLKDGHIFTWEETVHIGVEVCKALRHAHDRGIIHRDIKPANILLLKNGQVKVSDYGIAHFFGDSRLTTANMVIGTIEYMSPEQAQAGPLTPKSDIYSLGALLYALLTGSPPYRARTLPEILQRYRTGPPESIRFVRPEVPSVLDLFIMELLRVQPDKRPLDARIIGRRFGAIRLAFSQNPDQNPFLADSNEPTPVQTESTSTVRPVSARNFPDNDSFPVTEESVVADPSSGSNDNILYFSKNSGDYKTVNKPGTSSTPSSASFGLGGEANTNGMTIAEKPTKGSIQFDFPQQTDQTARAATGIMNTSALQKMSDTDLSFTLGTPVQFPPTSEHVSDNIPYSSFDDDFELNDGTDHGDSDSNEQLVTRQLDSINEPVNNSQNLPSASTMEVPGEKVNTDKSAVVTPSPSEEPTQWTNSLQNLPKNDSQLSKKTDSKVVFSESLSKSMSNRNQSGSREDRLSSSSRNPADSFYAHQQNTNDHTSALAAQTSSSGNPAEGTLSSATVNKTSHFTFVKEEELGNYTTEPEGQKYVSIKIWIFSIISISVGLLFWFSLKSPSADTLYQRIDTRIQESEDTEYYGVLRSAEKDLRSFISLYPNDSRAPKVLSCLGELELGNLERRLERQIERKTRDGSLSSVEDAYVEAIQIAKVNPEKGILKLQAFIDIFSTDDMSANVDMELTDDNPKERHSMGKKQIFDSTIYGRCVILAKRRLEKIMEKFERKKADELNILDGRLEYADSLETIDPERAKSIRQGIITFYSDRQWARPAIDSARAKLQAAEKNNAQPKK